MLRIELLQCLQRQNTVPTLPTQRRCGERLSKPYLGSVWDAGREGCNNEIRPKGLYTDNLRTPAPRTIPGMVFGTRVLKWEVYGIVG